MAPPEPAGAPTPLGGGQASTLDHIIRRLELKFAAALPEDSIEEAVRSAHAQLARTATITAYLPVLAERAATARLSLLLGAQCELRRLRIRGGANARLNSRPPLPRSRAPPHSSGLTHQ